jgi:hypothetical protein
MTFIHFYIHHEDVGFEVWHHVLLNWSLSCDLFLIEDIAANMKLEHNIPSPFIAFNLPSIQNYNKS